MSMQWSLQNGNHLSFSAKFIPFDHSDSFDLAVSFSPILVIDGQSFFDKESNRDMMDLKHIFICPAVVLVVQNYFGIWFHTMFPFA